MSKAKVSVTIRMTKVQRSYLRDLVREVSKKPCRRSNCGTACKCAKHMALDILPDVEKAVEKSSRRETTAMLRQMEDTRVQRRRRTKS